MSPISDTMTDEVARLRRLRQSALKVRALAAALNDGESPDRLYERGALLNWRIARIATGWLRSHPCQSYQKDPSFFESGADRLAAILLATMASLRGRGAGTFLLELRSVARELDDTRSLTLSADLSDSLGRVQSSMRCMLRDVEHQAMLETGIEADASVGASDALSARRLSASSYLAL